jgi:GTP-binding protein
VADLPGLIEGASHGAGLGIRFLRHVERTRLLVHLIDTSDMAEMDPVKAFEIIGGELGAFSERLLEKPMIVVATKLDATTDRTKLEELRKFCKKKGLEFHAISAAAGEGVKELVRGIADALDKIPKETLEDEGEVQEINEVNELEDEEGAEILDEQGDIGE